MKKIIIAVLIVLFSGNLYAQEYSNGKLKSETVYEYDVVVKKESTLESINQKIDKLSRYIDAKKKQISSLKKSKNKLENLKKEMISSGVKKEED